MEANKILWLKIKDCLVNRIKKGESLHPTSVVPPWETTAQQELKPEAAFPEVKTANWEGGEGRGEMVNNRITETKAGWKLRSVTLTVPLPQYSIKYAHIFPAGRLFNLC